MGVAWEGPWTSLKNTQKMKKDLVLTFSITLNSKKTKPSSNLYIQLNIV